MSTAERTRGLTVGDVLLGDSTDPGDRAGILSRSFSDRGVVKSGIKSLRHLSGPAMRAVSNELAQVVLTSLDLLDVQELLANGWRKYKDLTEAAERTYAAPGREELVALASHRIDSVHQPSVDLIVKEATVHTCVFDLTVGFDINGVMAVVRHGELAALRGGNCLITAELTLGGMPMLPSQERHVDLTKFINLKPAIRLLKTATSSDSGDDKVSSAPGG